MTLVLCYALAWSFGPLSWTSIPRARSLDKSIDGGLKDKIVVKVDVVRGKVPLMGDLPTRDA